MKPFLKKKLSIKFKFFCNVKISRQKWKFSSKKKLNIIFEKFHNKKISEKNVIKMKKDLFVIQKKLDHKTVKKCLNFLSFIWWEIKFLKIWLFKKKS